MGTTTICQRRLRRSMWMGWVLLVTLPVFQAAVYSQDKAAGKPSADDHLSAYFASQTRLLSKSVGATTGTLAQWKIKQSELRGQLLDMLGLQPQPPKTDLKVVFTGETEHDEFIVKNVHFQSRPGLYVTGNLYVPKKVDKRLPAILYVCGHGMVKKNGVSYGNKVHYHHHGSWFARNGYVCLTIDTLQLGEIEGIHHGTYREKMWWWLNRGYTPAGVEAWNCVRAIDLLQSLPEVDPDRIGVTGRSGGGAYSWWIAAIDERVQCAVPVAGITDLQNHVVDGCVEGHCDCMFMVNTYQWDYPTVAALVAPRPLLISNTDNDGIFPLDGVYRTYEKVKKIYRLYGAADRVALHITAGPHKDTQELRVHAFRWFNHFLKQDDSLIQNPAEKYFQPEQLKVFTSLPSDQLNTRIHETFVAAKEPSLPADPAQWKAMQSHWRKTLSEKSFRGWPSQDAALEIEVDSRQDLSSLGSDVGLSVLKFESQQHVPLTLRILQKGKLKDTNRVVIYLMDDQSKATLDWLSEPTGSPPAGILDRLNSGQETAFESVAAYLEKTGQTIAFFSPRGTGENHWKQEAKYLTQTQRRFYLLGQTADAMRVYDIVRAVEAIKQSSASDLVTMELNAQGIQAGMAVYAAIMDSTVSKLNLLDPPVSHRSGPILLNVRKIFDMPQAISLAGTTATVSIRTDSPSGFDYVTQLQRTLEAGSKVRFQKRKK